MSNKAVNQSVVRKLTSANIVKTLTEVLMVKTGIKAGPEFTGGH